MGQKNKAQGSKAKEKRKEMAPLYTDTACNRDAGISTWESMYRLLEEENPRIMKVAAVAGSQRSSDASLEDASMFISSQDSSKTQNSTIYGYDQVDT